MKLFDIEKLACRYYDRKTTKYIDVLDAEDIQIDRGEITVILGPSGSGKSTFMEAISLMSDTIDSENSRNVIFFKDGEESAGIDLVTIIREPNFDLQKLRFDKFCFIFQDTNIMGNFSALENVALPKMSNQPKDALCDANKILRDALNLKINLRKVAGEGYSGGQKQRFAFARAFLAQGEILFGDEPTGNLDKYNSEKLFGVIRQYVRNTDKQNNHSIRKIGAVIVTHSIDLALHFADQIIVIVKPERIDDESDSENKNFVKGYTNPFFAYRNKNESCWRIDNNMSGNFENGGILPLIDDDGSNRFTYKHESDIEQNPLIKDRLKKEIIFFLNNSYAAPQQLLIRIAQKLNDELKKYEESDSQFAETKKRLFGYFLELKTSILEQVDKSARKKRKIKDFEENYIDELKARLKNKPELLSLIEEIN